MVGPARYVETWDGRIYPIHLRGTDVWEVGLPDGPSAVIARGGGETWTAVRGGSGSEEARGALLHVLSALAPSDESWVAGVFEAVLPGGDGG